MSALEQEILEKFHQLPPAAKQRVRALIEQEVASEVGQPDMPAFSFDSWLRDLEALRQQIRASHGDKLPPMDVVGIPRSGDERCCHSF